MIMRANEDFLPWAELEVILHKLLEAGRSNDCVLICKVLKQTVEGYMPQCEVVDWVYNYKKLSQQESF